MSAHNIKTKHKTRRKPNYDDKTKRKKRPNTQEVEGATYGQIEKGQGGERMTRCASNFIFTTSHFNPFQDLCARNSFLFTVLRFCCSIFMFALCVLCVLCMCGKRFYVYSIFVWPFSFNFVYFYVMCTFRYKIELTFVFLLFSVLLLFFFLETRE